MLGVLFAQKTAKKAYNQKNIRIFAEKSKALSILVASDNLYAQSNHLKQICLS